MGFPDDFAFKGTKTEIAKQIGNAVPPDLAGAIATIVKDALDNLSSKPAKAKQTRKDMALGASIST
jgi:DNA (cytosine-5)-methyltransferase 1